MGKLVAQLAPEYGFHPMLTLSSGANLTQCTQADVAIEFTNPEAAPENLKQLAACGGEDRHWHHRLAGAFARGLCRVQCVRVGVGLESEFLGGRCGIPASGGNCR